MQDEDLFIEFQRKLLSKAGILIHKNEKWPLILANFSSAEIENLVVSLDTNVERWGKVFEILNVSETYFYRDPKQLNGIFHTILPHHWKSKSNAHISIWSAGCSKGEEAYSLAILTEILKQTFHLNFTFSILGTDIQSSSIDYAKEGVYSTYSVRAGLPLDFKSFLHTDETEVRVSQKIKNKVNFQVGNLLDHAPGQFDLIFCRNVLIYLDEDSKQKVIRRLASALKEGGILVLGHSEFLGVLPTSLTSHSISNSTSYLLKSQQTPKKEAIVTKKSYPPIRTESSEGKRSLLQTERDSVLNFENNSNLLESARMAKEQGNFDKMASLLKQALYENPKEMEAYYELANYYWEIQDRQTARKYQSQARIVFKNEPGLVDILKKERNWSPLWDEFLSEEL